MSQAGALSGSGGGGTADIQKINVQTGTSPVITANNTITFNGAVVPAGTNPVRTDGTAPATMALEVQTAQAIASTDATKIGLAAFDSADFTVDANGFVSSTITQGVVTIDGDTGSATGNTITFTGINAGSTVRFSASGSTVGLLASDANSNTAVGQSARAGGSSALNTIVGFGCGNNSIGNSNSLFGYNMATSCTGSNNCLFGASTGSNLTSASSNTAFGFNALGSLLTGTRNICFGLQSGSSYSSSESSNILIANIGLTSESNVIRIGTQGSSTGQQNTCYIAGISGVTVSNTNLVTIDTTTGQLGSQAVASAITTINGDSGSITGSTVTISAQHSGNHSGASVQFINSGTSSVLNLSDGSLNTFIGLNCGNLSTSGGANTGLGAGTLNSVSSGSSNIGIGHNALNSLATGNSNIAIGSISGSNYVGAETSNILIANIGVASESNVIRIGSTGQQNQCFVAGIKAASYSAGSPTPALTYCDTSNGQLVSNQATDSASATSTFGSLVVGTALQNTANYAILVNVSMAITAATGATIVMGVGSTNTPTTNTVVASFSAAETISFAAFVPAGYYMLVNTTGTIVVGSITTQTCAMG